MRTSNNYNPSFVRLMILKSNYPVALSKYTDYPNIILITDIGWVVKW